MSLGPPDLDAEAQSIRQRVVALRSSVADLVAEMRSTSVPLTLGEQLLDLGSVIIEPVRALLDEDGLDDERRGYLALAGFMAGDRQQSQDELFRQVRTLGPLFPISALRLARNDAEGAAAAILDGLRAVGPADARPAVGLVQALGATGVPLPDDVAAHLRGLGEIDLERELDALDHDEAAGSE